MAENKIDILTEMIRQKIDGCNTDELPDKFAAEFRIEDAGVFYIEILNGKITIAPYEYNDKDVLVQTDYDNLTKILNKELGIEKAIITRKASVSGNIQKAMTVMKKILKK